MMALMDDLKSALRSSAIKRKSLKSMKKAALNTTWSKPIKPNNGWKNWTIKDMRKSFTKNV